ncbi:MAG TPA: hypothetical protein VNT28_03650 [Candidatus Limnocylindrales bacterium]|jgi:hypothetical protein|nr:hypothetical protein [Candidatus Limnocylindrales bacterium]
MATWRCPHCATVQSESSRCFLCQRSATSCGTCALFRRSLVGGTGYCAQDRRREPLTGDEQRGCWTAAAQPATEGLFVALPPEAARPPAGRGLIDLSRS